jgi:hypothetical protein
VKQEIEKAFPGTVVEGNTKGSPRTGAFEVTDSEGNRTFAFESQTDLCLILILFFFTFSLLL